MEHSQPAHHLEFLPIDQNKDKWTDLKFEDEEIEKTDPGVCKIVCSAPCKFF